MRNLCVLLLLCSTAFAAPVSVIVNDTSGASCKDILIIIKSLETGKEQVRALSDAAGHIPRQEMKSGLYRLIATQPYGIWTTNVTEFWVGDKPIEVEVSVSPMSTHGYGDVVFVNPGSKADRFAEVRVLAPAGQPAAKARIFIRDARDTLATERYYLTDAEGRVRIDKVGEPTVVIVEYKGIVKTVAIIPEEKAATIKMGNSDNR